MQPPARKRTGSDLGRPRRRAASLLGPLRPAELKPQIPQVVVALKEALYGPLPEGLSVSEGRKQRLTTLKGLCRTQRGKELLRSFAKEFDGGIDWATPCA
eukprot:Hpha_TRINITY_DN37155_c0_g1::TRINITY_DN37155_c0_g1_i1::g.1564::m.1564